MKGSPMRHLPHHPPLQVGGADLPHPGDPCSCAAGDPAEMNTNEGYHPTSHDQEASVFCKAGRLAWGCGVLPAHMGNEMGSENFP